MEALRAESIGLLSQLRAEMAADSPQYLDLEERVEAIN
jgi:hypothetical protein